MISQEKLRILTPLRKFPKNVRDLGKLIVAKGLKKLPKVQKIAQSGHTGLATDKRDRFNRRSAITHRLFTRSFGETLFPGMKAATNKRNSKSR